MFLAVAGLATFGASCSSDDGGNNGGNGGGDNTKQLVAKATPSTVEVNKEVTFSATSEGKAVDGVSFYVGETKLDNPHKFTEAKEYKVVAKKEGFKDSAAITVKVTEEATPPGPEKTLVLSLVTDPADVKQGERFELKIVDGEDKPVTGAILLADGQATPIESVDGVFGVAYNGEPGEIYLSATKDGVYSNELAIEVHPGEPEPAPEGKITYDGVDNAVGGQFYGFLGNTADGSLVVVQASSPDGEHIAEAVLLAEPVIEDGYIVDFDFTNAIVLDYYYYNGLTDEDYDLSVKNADDIAVVTSFSFDGTLSKKTASFKLTATMEAGKVLDVLTDGPIKFQDLSGAGKSVTLKGDLAKSVQSATLKINQFTAM